MRPALALPLLVTACATAPKTTPWNELRGTPAAITTRRIAQGTLTGFVESAGDHAWLGIPYAAPPVGPLRWKAPRPPATFERPFEATHFGAVCPQIKGALLGGDAKDGVVGSEDCLTLNVYAPAMRSDEAAGARLPVMVWLHGGGNSIGTGATYGIARNLANRYRVIVVTLNYRLGILGWFHHPALLAADTTPEDASGNYGTLDQLAALRWVQQNIAAFGGDPADVMLFGESAGGFDTFSMLVSPLSAGLFQRAGIESGIPAGASMTEAWHFTDDEAPGLENSSGEILLMQLLADGKAKDRAGAKQLLATMSPDEVATYLANRTPAQLIGPLAGKGFGMYRAPALLQDGHVLPTEPLHTALAHAHQVPVLLGTNRDEFKLFMLGNPKYVSRFLGFHMKDEAVYERDASAVSRVWRVIGVDEPVDALHRAGLPTFEYRFDWDEEPEYLLANLHRLVGAAHGMELSFVFDDEQSEADPFGFHDEAHAPGRIALSRQMSSYWVQFAKTGDPGRGVDGTLPEWTEAGDAHRFIVFDTPQGGGVRMEAGAATLQELDDELWNRSKFSSPEERCEAYRLLFKGFAGPTGAWTPARAQRYAEGCPTK